MRAFILLAALAMAMIAIRANANLIQMPITSGSIPVVGVTYQSGGNTLTASAGGGILSH
jgi:hypothetical protein